MKRLAIAALALLVLVALGALGALWWWDRELDRFAQTPFGSQEEKVVEIPPGARMKEVAQLLADARVVADRQKLVWLARRLKRDRAIKTGEYAFDGPLVPEKVLDTIAAGRVRLYRCTVPEGLRIEEIAAILEKCGFGKAGEILRLAHDATFAKQVGLQSSSLEGFLFPDTYAFPKGAKLEAVLSKMVGRFVEEYRRADGRRRAGVTLDMHQTATLASIIEKETGAASERPRISCVFHNRLKKGMRLETDPTVIFAKILREGSFDGNITRADIETFHPYNTYKVKGLPPGPIASGGAAAIAAALAPIDCDDLFFVACGGGTHVFCPDYECHLRNVDRCQLGRH